MAMHSGPSAEGRTSWRRFGVAGGAGLAAVVAVGVLAANGALALSFAFSGIPFTLHADSLSGNGFVQYAYPDQLGSAAGAGALNAAAGKLINGSGTISNTASAGGATFASDTVTQLKTASIAGLAQTICAPTPLGNAIKVHLSGTGSTTAGDLTIQAPALTADSANFESIVIGETVASAISAQGVSDPYGALGSSLGGSFGQGAKTVVLTNVNQVGVGTEAATFNISGLKLYAEFVSSC